MIREVKFESQDRRIKQILAALNENGIKDIEEANAICDAAGIDPYKTCEETQPICFENAKWAYVVGCAIALKKGCKNAAEAAEAIGLGLQAFCIPGSVADDRKVGLGHGNLAARLLREETKCFAFLAGHESFAAAEGAIKIAAKADMVIIADEIQHVVDVLIHAFYAGIVPVFFKKLPCKGNAGKAAVLCQSLNLFIVKVARVGAKAFGIGMSGDNRLCACFNNAPETCC